MSIKIYITQDIGTLSRTIWQQTSILTWTLGKKITHWTTGRRITLLQRSFTSSDLPAFLERSQDRILWGSPSMKIRYYPRHLQTQSIQHASYPSTSRPHARSTLTT